MNKSSEVFISILTPSWNRLEFLQTLIDSLINQSYKNFEWVIGNDGSTDGTNEFLLKNLKKFDFKTNYICSNVRIGKSKIDNLLLDNARGKYLIWCDADDYLKPDALEKIVDIITNENKKSSDIIGVIGQNLDTNGKSQTFGSGAMPPQDGVYSFKELENHLIGDGTICVKRSLFHNKRWPEVDFLITESVLLRELYNDKNFFLTNDVLKIMDRTAENSVSFGSKMQYCRGSAYAIEGTTSIAKFNRLSLYKKFKNLLNYFRYCIHGDIKFFQAIHLWKVVRANKFLILMFPLSMLIAYFDILRNKVEKTHIEFEKNSNKAEIKIQNF